MAHRLDLNNVPRHQLHRLRKFHERVFLNIGHQATRGLACDRVLYDGC